MIVPFIITDIQKEWSWEPSIHNYHQMFDCMVVATLLNTFRKYSIHKTLFTACRITHIYGCMYGYGHLLHRKVRNRIFSKLEWGYFVFPKRKLNQTKIVQIFPLWRKESRQGGPQPPAPDMETLFPGDLDFMSSWYSHKMFRSMLLHLLAMGVNSEHVIM